ncbi:MAG: hypothetical protein R3268_12490 [Acidiferrobacterales bacterium]|nr:hypothetical protein [Acidiferrobacterales bacterium]
MRVAQEEQLNLGLVWTFAVDRILARARRQAGFGMKTVVRAFVVSFGTFVALQAAVVGLLLFAVLGPQLSGDWAAVLVIGIATAIALCAVSLLGFLEQIVAALVLSRLDATEARLEIYEVQAELEEKREATLAEMDIAVLEHALEEKRRAGSEGGVGEAESGAEKSMPSRLGAQRPVRD